MARIRIPRRTFSFTILISALLAARSDRLHAQAYISTTGSFTAVSQTEDFNFAVPAGSNNMILKTLQFTGGVNSAGISIPAGGLDSVFSLFTGGGTFIATNDDVSVANRDSLLAFNGSGTTLLGPLSAGDYRLNLIGFSGASGAWAVDMINTSSSITFTGATPSASSVLNQLALGGSDASHQAILNFSGGSLNIGSSLLMQANSNATFSGGTVSVGSLLSMAGGGSVIITGGSISVGTQWNVSNSTAVGISGGTMSLGNQIQIGLGSNVSVSQTNGLVTQPGGFASRMDIGGATGGSVWTIGGGTLESGNLFVASGGTGNFVQNGGQVNTYYTYVGAVNNAPGVYTLNGGTISNAGGILIGYTGSTIGSFIQNGGSIISSGIEVSVSPSAVATFTMNGGFGSYFSGYVAPYGNGTMILANSSQATFGGTLKIFPTGTLIMNGASLKAGTIDTTGGGQIIYNSGTINLTNSGLTVGGAGLLGQNLSITGNKAVIVSGTSTIEGGGVLAINGGTFSSGAIVNSGQLQLNSGSLILTNSSIDVGPGGLLGPTVVLSSGQSFSDTFIFPSTIESGGLLNLKGGAFSITSALTNNGQVLLEAAASNLNSSTLINNGLISGSGRVTGTTLYNQTTGELRADSADWLRVTQPVVNSALINVLGGTMDMTSLLTNFGNVNLSGGVLRAGSISNASGAHISGRGAIQASGGISGKGIIQLSSGISDIYAPLTLDGPGKVIVTGGATATFYNDATLLGGSEFRVSTGSEAVFLGAVTGTGSFTGQGMKIFEGGGSFSAIDTITGSSIVSANTSMTAARFREASLEVDGTTHITPNGTANGTSKLNTLNIAGSTGAWTGKLDLSNNSLVIDYSGPAPIADVKDQIKTARAGGSWSGNGITSSMADATTYALGYADNMVLGLVTFAGQPVDSSSVLVKYTYYGDSNLDGQVDGYDLTALAAHWQQPSGAVWTSGDFNYDGIVNISDLHLLALDWHAGVGSPLSEPLGAALLSLVVPEPDTLGCAAMLLLVLHRRRGWR